jgi:hypothetical protein
MTKKSDSKFEQRLRDGVLKDVEFHPDDKIEYVSRHKYEPDFVCEIPDDKGSFHTIFIEAKGRFRDSKEAAKYKDIREAITEYTCYKGKQTFTYELVFLFQKPDTPMPHSKKRKKCGTKQTHSEWADRNGFRWFTEQTIQEIL